jgi:hypothetical protein
MGQWVERPALPARYVLRAISADGVVVALRRQPNRRNGTLAFWKDAISKELADGRGYELTADEEVASDRGVPGRLLSFAAESRGSKARYLVGIFVDGEDVLVAEAGGKADAVDARADSIRKCLLSAR